MHILCGRTKCCQIVEYFLLLSHLKRGKGGGQYYRVFIGDPAKVHFWPGSGGCPATSVLTLKDRNVLNTGQSSAWSSVRPSGCSWPGAAVAHTRPKRTYEKSEILRVTG
jgi:hypothetical protein